MCGDPILDVLMYGIILGTSGALGYFSYRVFRRMQLKKKRDEEVLV